MILLVLLHWWNSYCTGQSVNQNEKQTTVTTKPHWDFLAVQWLRLCATNTEQRAGVHSWVRELDPTCCNWEFTCPSKGPPCPPLFQKAILPATITSETVLISYGSSKESPCNAGDLGLISRSGRSPGEGSSHSSVLAWRIQWTEEPDALQSIELRRVGYDWATNTF